MSLPITKKTSRLRFRQVDYKVDSVVDAIASACGLVPELTGLVMSTILGGIAKPDNGNVPAILRGTSPGMNLLLVGADQDPRLQWLLSMLLAPLAVRQDRLRDAASVCRRPRLDQHEHGVKEHGNLDDPTTEILDRFKTGPFSDTTGLSMNYGRKRELDAVNHPSVFLSNPMPDTITPALDEAMNGQLLVVDGDGAVLSAITAPTRKRSDSAALLSALLNQQGSDGIMCNLDPRRGPGSLQTRRLNLLSLISRDSLLHLAGTGDKAVKSTLGRFLVVDLSALPPADHGCSSEDLTAALDRWNLILDSVLSVRIAHQRGGLSPDVKISDHLMHVMADHHANLHAVGKQSPLALGALWALPLQLYTSLGNTSRGGNGGAVQVLPGLDHLCEWAVKQHVSTLSRLRDQASERELTRRREAILRAIGRHGPCTSRILLRSFTVQRKELYEPLVAELVAEGHVIMVDDDRFALPKSTKTPGKHLETKLNK